MPSYISIHSSTEGTLLRFRTRVCFSAAQRQLECFAVSSPPAWCITSTSISSAESPLHD